MQDMEILSQMLRPSALVEVPKKKEQGKRAVKLIESQAPDSCITIRGLPDDAIVIKPDTFPVNIIFRGNNNECKRADFVIISKQKESIIYIELKSKKANQYTITYQLMGAQCFIKYCQEIGKTFWKEENFLNGYESLFVSIGHTGSVRNKTSRNRGREVLYNERHNAPDRALKLDWFSTLEYYQLVRRSSA